MKTKLLPLFLAGTVLFGLGVVLGRWRKSDFVEVRPSAKALETTALAYFGSILFCDTQRNLGPGALLPENRYTKAGLNCSSCHINGGISPFSLNLLGVSKVYPKKDPQTGKMQTLAQRVNQCMERSMNGRPLPDGSRALNAFVAYLNSLQPVDAGASIFEKGDELFADKNNRAGFVDLAEGGNVVQGGEVYRKSCAACHGESGEGLILESSEQIIYTIPPLWGSHSFNHLAGMNRPATAAQFIYDYMPRNNPNLTVRQAHDVAAYLLSEKRP